LIDPWGAVNGILAGMRQGFFVCPRPDSCRNFFQEGRAHMTASIAIQVLPAVDSEEELIRIVDEVIDYIRSTGLNYYVGPFETTIEGDSYDQLMDIAKECQHVAVRAGAPSVSAYIKVVYRPEGEILTIDRKVTKHHTA
jgi:uncharacterized protein YqgV (UPF0045/DUF77 family)